MKSLALAGLLFVLQPVQVHAGTSTADPPITNVSMQQYECFWGTCPNYVVSINSDGSAAYIGLTVARTRGPVQLRVKPADFNKIVAAIHALDYFALKRSYTREADGCKEMRSDQSSVTFYVTRGGKTKDVTLYYGCELPGVADKLSSLAELIDQVSGDEALLGRDQLKVQTGPAPIPADH